MSAAELVPWGPGGEIDETPDGRLQRLVAGFLLAQRSPATRAAYRDDLRCFVSWCPRWDVPPLMASRTHLDAYSRWLEQQGYAARTHGRRLSTLSSWFSWLEDEGYRDDNPARRVKRPAIGEPTTRALSEPQAKAVLAVAVEAGPDRELLVRLLLTSGLRCSEAIAVDGTVDDGGHRIATIRRKGGHLSKIPLPPATAALVDQLEGVARTTPGPVLRRADGQPLCARTARRWVGAVGHRAGVEGLHPHMLRTAFVTLLLGHDVALWRVQAAAGHKSPSTTMGYNRNRESWADHPSHLLTALLAS